MTNEYKGYSNAIGELTITINIITKWKIKGPSAALKCLKYISSFNPQTFHLYVTTMVVTHNLQEYKE